MSKNHVQWLLLIVLMVGTAPLNGKQSTAKWTGVTGRVVYGDTPMRRAFVYVRDPRGKSDTLANLDADGGFSVMLPPGLYDIFVSEASFLPTCQRVEVIDGQKTRVSIHLQTDEEHLED